MSGKIVIPAIQTLDLDAIQVGTKPMLEVMQEISRSNQVVLQSSSLLFTTKMLDNQQLLKPLIETIEQANQSLRIFEQHTDMARSIADSLQKMTLPLVNLSFQFSAIAWPATQSEDPAPQAMLLAVTTDEFGVRSIGGKKTARMNAKTSRHGQLLDILENSKGQMVSKADIKANIKAGDPVQIMKDLKTDLRRLGFKLDYEAYRHQGWVYHGVLKREQ